MELISTPSLAIFALIAGTLFGFLLRKATVSRFDTIVGQLLLKDFTVMKVILTAIVTGSIGISLASRLGWVPTLHLSQTPILATMLGGGIFGIGMAVTGYCPGTAMAALAEGAKDMIFAFLGLITGVFIYSLFHPSLKSFLGQKDAFFQQTLFSYFQVSEGQVISILLVLWASFALGVKWLEGKKQKTKALN